MNEKKTKTKQKQRNLLTPLSFLENSDTHLSICKVLFYNHHQLFCCIIFNIIHSLKPSLSVVTDRSQWEPNMDCKGVDKLG